MIDKDFEEKVILPFIANCGFKAGDKIWTYITDERKTCFAIYNLTVKSVAATYDGPAYLGRLMPIVEVEEEGKFAGIGYGQCFTAIFKTREECIEAARKRIEDFHKRRIEKARRIIEKSENALRMIEDGEPHVSQERVTALLYLECDKRTIGPDVKYKYVSVPPSNTAVLMQENDDDTIAMIENVLKEEFAK